MPTLSDVRDRISRLMAGIPTSMLADANTYIRSAQWELESRHTFKYMELDDHFVAVPGSHSLYLATRNAFVNHIDSALIFTPTYIGKAAIRQYPSSNATGVDNTLYMGSNGKPYRVSISGAVTEMDWIPDPKRHLFESGERFTSDRDEASPDLSGPPKYLQETATSFRVWPLPDTPTETFDGLIPFVGYQIYIPVIHRMAALTLDTDTNQHLDNPVLVDYLVYRAAASMLDDNDDMRGDRFESKSERAFTVAKSADNKARVARREFSIYPNRDVKAYGPQVRRR